MANKLNINLHYQVWFTLWRCRVRYPFHSINTLSNNAHAVQIFYFIFRNYYEGSRYTASRAKLCFQYQLFPRLVSFCLQICCSAKVNSRASLFIFSPDWLLMTCNFLAIKIWLHAQLFERKTSQENNQMRTES